MSLHALLIGIDAYLPNRLPDGSRYESLSGSVRDVERVEQFLRGEIGRPPERILKLTSSRDPGGASGPSEPGAGPGERRPTYENMVAAFRELIRGAEPGDQVYIHYSGHGGRTATLFPEVKGPAGFDEALVPCDIGAPQARYLRGVEVSWLVREMAAKGLLVTLVFDCCHAGGANRGPNGAVKRGLGVVDRSRRPDGSVATREELLGILRPPPAPGPARRNVVLQSWLPEPQGLLLAACRPQEFAFEFPFADGESQGALTYWLLDSLRQGGTGLTGRQLFDRVFAKVHNQFASQTPMLVGESDRAFFGADPPAIRMTRGENATTASSAATVLAIDGSRVLLNVGQAQGARVGMRFAIHPGAVVEIDEADGIGATESWAKIIESTRSLIQQGAQAVPQGVGADRAAMRLQGAVRAVDERVRRAVAADPSGFLRLAGEKEAADFQVRIDGQGTCEILDAAGRPIPHTGPPIGIDRPGAAGEVVRRLIHLTRYRNVSRVENADEQSPLHGRLAFRVLGTQTDFVPGDKPDPRPAGPPPLDLRPGEWLFVEVANRSSRVLNVAVLDLQPDWGISQIFPGGNDAAFWPLDPGEAKTVRIRGFLPAGYEEGTDILKVFATVGAPSFRWLLLPPLDVPRAPSTKRNLNVSAFASEEWTTEQLEVRLRR